MCANEVGKANGIVAVVLEEQLERVHHDQHKLNHLHHGQIFLPPEITLHSRSHRGQHIVRIHEDVHECVEESKECRMSARRKLDAPPNGDGHNAMMDHMQRGHLIVPFAHHKEERVKELGKLGEVIPPAAPCSLSKDIYIEIYRSMFRNREKFMHSVLYRFVVIVVHFANFFWLSKLCFGTFFCRHVSLQSSQNAPCSRPALARTFVIKLISIRTSRRCGSLFRPKTGCHYVWHINLAQ